MIRPILACKDLCKAAEEFASVGWVGTASGKWRPFGWCTPAHVYSKDGGMFCHVTSFIRVADGKIASVDEYWGDDGPAPGWRQEKHIGTKIM